jgi:hypothetical protein
MIWVPMQPAFERPIQSLSMSVVAVAGPWTVGKREQGIQLRFRDNLLCPEPLSQAEVQYPDTHSRSIEQLRFLNHRLIEQLRFLQWHQIRTVILLLFFYSLFKQMLLQISDHRKRLHPFQSFKHAAGASAPRYYISATILMMIHTHLTIILHSISCHGASW